MEPQVNAPAAATPTINDVFSDGASAGANSGGSSGAGMASTGTPLSGGAPNTGTPPTGAGNGAGATAVSIPANWKESLSPELREAPYLKNVDSVETLVKNYGHAQSMVGADKIVIPKAGATPEQWKNDVYVKLGLPEKVEDFKVDLSKDMVADPAFMKEFAKTSHEQGILPRQATALANWFGKVNAQAEAAMVAKQAADAQANLTQFKSSAGEVEYNQTIGDAKRAMQALPPEVAKALRDKGMGNDVNFIKAMATLATGLKEGGIKGGASAGSGMHSQESARAMVEGLKKLPSSHPYFDSSNPDHVAVRAEYKQAFAMAFPEKNA